MQLIESRCLPKLAATFNHSCQLCSAPHQCKMLTNQTISNRACATAGAWLPNAMSEKVFFRNLKEEKSICAAQSIMLHCKLVMSSNILSTLKNCNTVRYFEHTFCDLQCASPSLVLCNSFAKQRPMFAWVGSITDEDK